MNKIVRYYIGRIVIQVKTFLLNYIPISNMENSVAKVLMSILFSCGVLFIVKEISDIIVIESFQYRTDRFSVEMISAAKLVND